MTYRCLVCSGMITNVRSSYEDREIDRDFFCAVAERKGSGTEAGGKV